MYFEAECVFISVLFFSYSLHSHLEIILKYIVEKNKKENIEIENENVHKLRSLVFHKS